VIIVVKLSLKLLSLFCSLGDNGLVVVPKLLGGFVTVAVGAGGGKILLLFDSTDRLGSLTTGWIGSEVGRTPKIRYHCYIFERQYKWISVNKIL